MRDVKKLFTFLAENQTSLMNYLKSRYRMYHRSNVFYRDIQFGIRYFLGSKKIKVSYTESELLANEIINLLEGESTLLRVGNMSWVLNYPSFITSTTQAPPQTQS
ncbi:MAG: hypothetical protein KJ666_08235 [Bacteroidetes bacterium]|nr:hypothetical protein [Bacteroidota bacterium]MBU2585368.1 hypothetical protein [Bacteroidota bacterium]